MTLLGNRLLVAPVKKDKTDSGIYVPETASAVDQQYEITHVGDEMTDERFTQGKRVVITDQILNRVPKLKVGEKEYALITPDNIVAFPV